MEKTNYKKYIFRISLVLALLVSAVLCVYTIQNYKSNDTMTENMPFNGQFNQNGNGEDKESPDSRGEFARPSNNNEQQDQNGSGDVQGSRGNRQGKDGNHQNGPGGNGGKDNGSMPQGRNNNNMHMGSADTKYLPALSIYSGIILLLSCGVYYLFKRKKLEINIKDEKLLIITLLVIGFLLRIAASNLVNAHNDLNLFKNWAETAANGLSNFYSSARQADYPPLYIYVLGVIGKIANMSIFNSYYSLLLKMPSIIADVITTYLIYKLGKKYLNSLKGIFLAGFYIFNPAIFIDSTFWGQVDSFFTLLIVVAIYLLCQKKYVFSSIIFTIAVLMKPQGIIFLPILFFELVRQKKIKNFIYAAISAIITALIIIIPFSLNNQSPLWIFNLYSKTISEYPYASVNGFNFFSLIGGNYQSDNSILFLLSYHTIGMSFIVITTLIGWYVYIKGNDRKYVSAIALLQIAGVFTFSVGMHERYLFPAVALAILAFIYLKDRRVFALAIGFSITSYVNISTVYFKMNETTFNILLKATSFLNILLVLYLVKVLFDKAVKKISVNLEKEDSEVI